MKKFIELIASFLVIPTICLLFLACVKGNMMFFYAFLILSLTSSSLHMKVAPTEEEFLKRKE